MHLFIHNATLGTNNSGGMADNHKNIMQDICKKRKISYSSKAADTKEKKKKKQTHTIKVCLVGSFPPISQDIKPTLLCGHCGQECHQ